jgi:hypothetical protein
MNSMVKRTDKFKGHAQRTRQTSSEVSQNSIKLNYVDNAWEMY